eukprot:UN13715
MYNVEFQQPHDLESIFNPKMANLSAKNGSIITKTPETIREVKQNRILAKNKVRVVNLFAFSSTKF